MRRCSTKFNHVRNLFLAGVRNFYACEIFTRAHFFRITITVLHSKEKKVCCITPGHHSKITIVPNGGAWHEDMFSAEIATKVSHKSLVKISLSDVLVVDLCSSKMCLFWNNHSLVDWSVLSCGGILPCSNLSLLVVPLSLCLQRIICREC